jgi:hypothetical protein
MNNNDDQNEVVLQTLNIAGVNVLKIQKNQQIVYKLANNMSASALSPQQRLYVTNEIKRLHGQDDLNAKSQAPNESVYNYGMSYEQQQNNIPHQVPKMRPHQPPAHHPQQSPQQHQANWITTQASSRMYYNNPSMFNMTGGVPPGVYASPKINQPIAYQQPQQQQQQFHGAYSQHKLGGYQPNMVQGINPQQIMGQSQQVPQQVQQQQPPYMPFNARMAPTIYPPPHQQSFPSSNQPPFRSMPHHQPVSSSVRMNTFMPSVPHNIPSKLDQEKHAFMSESKRRLLEAVANDHKKVLQPDVSTPFTSIRDVIDRLLPYHIYHYPDEDLIVDKAEFDGAIYANLLNFYHRTGNSLKKYKYILKKSSENSTFPNDLALLCSKIINDDERRELNNMRHGFQQLAERSSSRQSQMFSDSNNNNNNNNNTNEALMNTNANNPEVRTENWNQQFYQSSQPFHLETAEQLKGNIDEYMSEESHEEEEEEEEEEESSDDDYTSS